MESIANALKPGAVLEDRYRIEAILGEGGFGITYKAHDAKLDCTVVIKEFLPNDFAARASDSISVQPRTNRGDDFEYGLKSFLEEARTLAKFQHANIVAVTNFIEANGSAYFIMNYAEGTDLSEWLKKHEVLNEDIILKIITPILEGLAEVHKTGLMHRDIKPGNIYLRNSGGPMLIDFGAARQSLGEHSKSISAIISQGYAPPEQYTTRGKQGAFTDLYAVGATLYRMIVGKAPVESSDRSHAKAEGEADPMIPTVEAGKGKVSDWLLQLTDQMLEISAKDRPQTAESVLEAIKNKTTAVGCAVRTETQPEPDNKTRVVRSGERFDKKSKSQPEQNTSGAHGAPYGKIVAVIVVVAAIAGGSWWFSQSDSSSVAVNAPIKSKALAKGNAILYVDSQPADAEIYLDNILLGRTPYKNEALPKGEHEIKLVHKDSEDQTDNITLADNEISKKQYQLKPASGNISLFSTPEGASISIDGSATGKQTPATLKGITAGEHQLKLSKDTYYPKEITINVLKGKASREDITLEGGDLVEYEGEWLKPGEKEKRVVQAKRLAGQKAAEEAKRLAEQKAKQQRIALMTGKMISIPAGSFQMDTSNGGRAEQSVRLVSIKAFKLGQYEVTQKQWRAVMGNNPSNFKDCDDCPVEEVSWEDIQGFLKKLNKKTAQRFRLPSEAEWEYACRSGGKDEEYCGGNDESRLAWYSSNSGDKTHPVGQKQANGLGLYDMSGNLYEWTQDCWNSSYTSNNGEALQSGDCTKRVLRGGSWYNFSNNLRSANLTRSSVEERNDMYGFRLAQD